MTNNLPTFITSPDPTIYLSNRYAVIDFETTNLDYGDARNPHNRIIFGYCHSPILGKREILCLDDLRGMATALNQLDFIVCHNTKFELKWFIRAGVDVSKLLFYDTMLGDYVRSGNRKQPLNLNAVCERYDVALKHSYVHDLIQLGVCPSDISYNALKEYCINDVEITEQIMLRQRLILWEEKLLPVFFIRNITTPVIADMEMHGMFLDKELVYTIATDLNKEYNQLIQQLDEITGGINMGSPKQVVDFLYKTLEFPIPKDHKGKPMLGKPTKAWPGGLPKTDEDAIKALKPTNENQRKFIELKKTESKLRKKITGYSDKFVVAVENNNCMLHGDFNQHVTGTHRLSSSHPNLQNIDRQLKRVVTARKPGWKILSADYAGLEFRVGGQLSQDPQVLDDIVNKFDVHSYTASIIREQDWIAAGCDRNSKAGKIIRYEVKPDTFGPMYGKVSGTPEQRKYFDAFRVKYHVMTAMQNAWVDEVLDKGYLTTVTGLKFYFPGTEYTRSGYVINSTNIKNYPIQMFATADIAPTGVALLWYNMKALDVKSFLIAEVHDSGVAEVHPDEVELVKELADRCMVRDIVPFFNKVINYNINYLLETEIEVHTHWDWSQENK